MSHSCARCRCYTCTFTHRFTRINIQKASLPVAKGQKACDGNGVDKLRNPCVYMQQIYWVNN